MAYEMIEAWRSLRVGDFVCVSAWPPELRKETLHEDTIEVYERIIRTKHVFRVHHIDTYGIPYGQIVDKDESGNSKFDYIGLNHSNVEIVDNQYL